MFRPADVEQDAPVQRLCPRDHEGVGRSAAPARRAAGDPRPPAADTAAAAAAAADDGQPAVAAPAAAGGVFDVDTRPPNTTTAPIADL